MKTAIVLIEESGIEHLSLRHAAKLCGVSASAVYRYFADKNHLLIACATEGYLRLARAMKELSAPYQGDVRLELTHLGIGYLTFAYEHPKLFNFMFSADLSGASAEQLEIFMMSYLNLHSVAEKGIEQEAFRGSADTVTWKAWSLVHGLAMLVIAKRIPVSSFEEYLLIARDIFVGSIE